MTSRDDVDVRVADVMTPDPVSVQLGASAVEAARLMKQHRVGALPVCDGTRVVGIVTDRDLAIRCVADGHVAAGLSSIVTLFPYTVTPETTIADAADLMTLHRVKRLVVTRGDAVVGILSSSDLLRHAAERAHATPPGVVARVVELETMISDDEPALLHEP